MTSAPAGSDRQRRWRMCESKRQLRNMRHGHMAAEAMRVRGHDVHPYKCHFCGCIHLGQSKQDGAE